jgi:glycosyltransferase involved in cell wall biosynthesis
VYPGVEYQRYNNESEDRNEKDIKKYILAVGAMIPMKNYFRLLKAFSYVNHQQRSRIKLIIIGDGPLKKEILLFSRKLRLENVEFLSNISEQLLSGYYANCSFVIHVAVHEPFGLVPLEAAIHGKPAIVSHNGGISEFVEHERSGLIVDPYNPKKIAEAMEYLVDNERLTKEMGFRAMEKALNEFTIEKSTENLIKNLNSLF